jgi:IS30 family transposase
MLGRSPQTINNELKRGTVQQVKKQKTAGGKVTKHYYTVYSVNAADEGYKQRRKACGRTSLLFSCEEFLSYADRMIRTEKWSPDAVVGRARSLEEFEGKVIPCTKTLYNWIDLCLLEIRNHHLHLKVRRNTKKARIREHKKVLGQSIDDRPQEVLKRAEFGHWEIDTVVGKKSGHEPVLLTLIERKTRFDLVLKIDGKTAPSVSETLKDIAKVAGKEQFSKVFKSITADNGSEFAGLSEALQSLTSVYFAHPYSSWERGSNENHNGIIRRFIPKGKSMLDVGVRSVRRIQDWMNDLPRKILDYATPSEAFVQELIACGIQA